MPPSPSPDFEITVSDLHAPTPPQRGMERVLTTRFLSRPVRQALVLLVLVGLLLTTLTSASPRHAPHGWLPGKPATFTLASLGFPCLGDVAWDPQHPHLAMLGCGTAPTTHVLVLLDVPRQLTQRIALDPLAGRADVVYHHLVWTRDDSQLVVTFTSAQQMGLLVLREDGTLVRRLLSPSLPATSSLSQWDLAQGNVQALDLPPAPQYQWQATGLAPAVSADLPASGQRATSAVVSLWQPGLLIVGTPPAAQWTAYPFSAWSPDHRWFVTTLVLGARLSTTALQPVDAALNALLHHAGSHSLAWRPDGRVLADLGPDQQLTLYATATGTRLRHLPLRHLASASLAAVADVLLSWSPDGGQLTLSDARQGTLTVWPDLGG